MEAGPSWLPPPPVLLSTVWVAEPPAVPVPLAVVDEAELVVSPSPPVEEVVDVG